MTAEFFDSLYADADGDEAAIPWQQALSRRLIGEWVRDLDPTRHRRALVVAAGLGDDAAALAGPGREVVAFDQSPTAVAWARRRHPDAHVEWRTADLLDPPSEWEAGFDLVVEVFTVQSIPPGEQALAAGAARSFVAPGGTLVAVAVVHDGSLEPEGPPWPLHPGTLDVLADGLVERARHTESLSPTISCVLIEWVLPLA